MDIPALPSTNLTFAFELIFRKELEAVMDEQIIYLKATWLSSLNFFVLVELS